MNFGSDNTAVVAPRLMRALAAANAVPAAMPYGNDDWTRRVEAAFAETFETKLAAFPVATGTAANALCLGLAAPPYGAIFCHASAHAATDECGAPEFFTGGAKLVTLPGDGGKIAPETLDRAVRELHPGTIHHVQPAAVSLTNITELGTAYTPDEVAAIARVCRRHRLVLHMDGARFANAVAGLGCAPAELTWKAGVDLLSFGATKNGALAAEAVIVFRRDLAASLPFRRKRAGHVFSKHRFLSAQLEAYLAGGYWLALARRANRQARRLAAGLARLPGVAIAHAPAGNLLWATLPRRMADALARAGFVFYRQGETARPTVRLVASFATDPAHVDRFLAVAARAAPKSPQAPGTTSRPAAA
jgi:threonine aldolase